MSDLAGYEFPETLSSSLSEGKADSLTVKQKGYFSGCSVKGIQEKI